MSRDNRSRLAAGDDEPVEPVELLGKAHLDRLRAEPPQHGRVLAEVSLHGEDADRERLGGAPGHERGWLGRERRALLGRRERR